MFNEKNVHMQTIGISYPPRMAHKTSQNNKMDGNGSSAENARQKALA